MILKRFLTRVCRNLEIDVIFQMKSKKKSFSAETFVYGEPHPGNNFTLSDLIAKDKTEKSQAPEPNQKVANEGTTVSIKDNL